MKVNTPAASLLLLCLVTSMAGAWSARGQSAKAPSESDYYSIDSIPVPDGLVLEASGLAFDERGDVMVTTRRGEVWRIRDPDGVRPTFEKFAEGLNEPLGIAYRDGSWFTVQMGELTRLDDVNGDGTADRFRTIYRWPLSGNFHEYSYGPEFLPNGEMVVNLNVTLPGTGASLARWRGWMLRVTEDGRMTPHAVGLRSPNGIGINAEGDIFYADNEGRWIGSGWITHVEEGDFTGRPEGLRWTHLPESPLDLRFEEINELQDRPWKPMHEYARDIPEMKLPTVWIPHPVLGVSTSDILLIEHDRQIGPFAGQLLVADYGHAAINRVYLEKVDGEYQGAVFRLRDGFSSGINRLAWGPDDRLYVAMSDRGFESAGEGSDGVDRMNWSGDIPFEMTHIRAESDGFTITFTHPVDAESAGDVASYRVTDFTYPYHRRYYSDIINRETKSVEGVDVSEDLRSVRLYVDGLREKYIHEVRADGVRSAEGAALLHPVGYYTLNNIPEGARSLRAAVRQTDAVGDQTNAAPSSKNVTEMPDDWTSGPDQTVQLGAGPGLRFDRDVITVRAGSRIALTFSNNDGMQHNVVIVQPGAADAVGRRAVQLGVDAEALDYVPRTDEVLFHSSLLDGGAAETIYLQAPDTPGDYPFICTFAGHYTVMRGILRVE